MTPSTSTLSALTNTGLVNAGSGDDTVNMTLGILLLPAFTVVQEMTPSSFPGSTDGGGNLYDAGTGADTIFFQSAGASTLSGATIAGGDGADSINIGAVLCWCC